LVGSEGTLGFIEEVVFRTVLDAPCKYTGIVMFASIEAAAEAVSPLRDRGAAAVELMDAASLWSVAHLPWVPEFLRIAPDENEVTALLVEFHAATDEELRSIVEGLDAVVANWQGCLRQQWSADTAVQAAYWRVRKGLMPTVGAARPPGTTMINEDVAVPPHLLAQLVRDLRACFDRHDYNDAIIFGHAKDGNLHFVVNQDFSTAEEVERYARFMEDLALVVADAHGGSLKAEHGTGRNMAPFVEREWGSAAYRIMRRVKAILDPENILNPGVVLNDDSRVHLHDIKSVPAVDPTIDRCIECGFCERVCPTRDVTLTPRQRITLRRDMTLRSEQERQELLRDYAYAGTDTCVTDGMCGLVCPVGIDTGDMVKDLRHTDSSGLLRSVASVAAANFSSVNVLARTASRLLSAQRGTPNPSTITIADQDAGSAIIYLPSCPSRWTGADSAAHGLPTAIMTLAQRAGIPLHIPNEYASMCCGQVFDSKGLQEAGERVRTQTLTALRDVHPSARVVVDASTCACALRDHGAHDHIIDITQWIEEDVMPLLTITSRKKRVILHPGCGIEKLGSVQRMVRIAKACSDEVVVPHHAHCCGMGGDRGIRYPEIPLAATGQEACEIMNAKADGWYSANPLCEHGLTSAMGKPYRSIVQLVMDASAQ
jgi:D-lactate dehydrogenase